MPLTNVDNLDEVVPLLKKLSQDISDIKQQNIQIAQQGNELREEFKNFKSECKTQMEHLSSRVDEIQKECEALKLRAQAAERKARRHNLTIYGLEEQNSEDIDLKVQTVFQQHLNITLAEQDIRESYRIGRPTPKKVRPVLVELVSAKLKSDVLSNVGKLKGSRIVITQDYTPEDYLKNTFLVTKQKEFRSKGQTAKVKGQTLIIDGTIYTFEELKSEEGNLATLEENKKRVREASNEKEDPQVKKNLRRRLTSR